MLQNLNGTSNIQDYEFLIAVIKEKAWFLAHYLENHCIFRGYRVSNWPLSSAYETIPDKITIPNTIINNMRLFNKLALKLKENE